MDRELCWDLPTAAHFAVLTSFATTSWPRPPRITAALANLSCTPPSRRLSAPRLIQPVRRNFFALGSFAESSISAFWFWRLSRFLGRPRFLCCCTCCFTNDLLLWCDFRSSFSAENSDLSTDVYDGFLRSDDCLAFSVLIFDGLRRTGFWDASFVWPDPGSTNVRTAAGSPIPAEDSDMSADVCGSFLRGGDVTVEDCGDVTGFGRWFWFMRISHLCRRCPRRIRFSKFNLRLEHYLDCGRTGRVFLGVLFRHWCCRCITRRCRWVSVWNFSRRRIFIGRFWNRNKVADLHSGQHYHYITTGTWLILLGFDWQGVGVVGLSSRSDCVRNVAAWPVCTVFGARSGWIGVTGDASEGTSPHQAQSHSGRWNSPLLLCWLRFFLLCLLPLYSDLAGPQNWHSDLVLHAVWCAAN